MLHRRLYWIWFREAALSPRPARPGWRIARGKGIETRPLHLIQGLGRTPVPDEVCRRWSAQSERVRNQRRKADGIALVRNRICRNDPAAKRRKALERIFGKNAMHNDHHGSRKALKRKFESRFDQRAAGRGDVIDQHRLPATPSGQIG
jgi:hypothetical protein